MKYAIIGAGIGGLTTALAFERKGIDYQVFERASRISEVGAGIWLAPNALQVLESLDVLDSVISKGNSIDRITLGLSDLSPLSDTIQDFAKHTFGYSTIAIHRAELQKLLFDRIPNEKVFLGKSFESYELLSTGKSKLHFQDATSIETDFIIGADGINSKVRKQLFPESKIRFSGQTCWRGVAEMQIDSAFEHHGMELWGNQIRFGLSRIAEDKVYWFAVANAKPRQKDNVDTVNQDLQTMFSDFDPLVLSILKATPKSNILRNDINDLHPLKKWYEGTVCLIGDAGHATTPNMGQGGAQAIEDAHYLSKIIKENPQVDAFELFQQKRQKKVQTIVSQSWMTGKMAHWKYGKGLRNLLLKNTPMKFLEKKMLEMYSIEK